MCIFSVSQHLVDCRTALSTVYRVAKYSKVLKGVASAKKAAGKWRHYVTTKRKFGMFYYDYILLYIPRHVHITALCIYIYSIQYCMHTIHIYI